ncbi:unnamed protein product [Moneuplotes crassus]|uniref:Uncharacterized protein n=1 Tax=Euplotes crassus TaxID=5936 RepID=A0AAD2D8I5_EUPCR|nr:unnamed protein product [Moneuplotes crassus]
MSRKGKPSSVAKQIQRQNEQLLRSASKSTLKSRVSDANRSVLDHVPNHFETDNSGSLNHQSSRDRITEPSMHTNFTRLNTEGQALDDTCASSINSRNKAAWLRKMLHSRADYEKAKARLGIDVGDDFVPNYNPSQSVRNTRLSLNTLALLNPTTKNTSPLKRSRSRSDQREISKISNGISIIKEEDDSFSKEPKKIPTRSIKGLVEKYVQRELAASAKYGAGDISDVHLRRLVEESLGKQELLQYQIKDLFKIVEGEVPTLSNISDLIESAVNRKVDRMNIEEKVERMENQIKALVGHYKADHDHTTEQILNIQDNIEALKDDMTGRISSLEYDIAKYENKKDAIQGINMRLHNIEAELDQFKIRTDTNINEVHRRVDSKIFVKNRDGPRSSHLPYNLTEGDIAHKADSSEVRDLSDNLFNTQKEFFTGIQALRKQVDCISRDLYEHKRDFSPLSRIDEKTKTKSLKKSRKTKNIEIEEQNIRDFSPIIERQKEREKIADERLNRSMTVRYQSILNEYKGSALARQGHGFIHGRDPRAESIPPLGIVTERTRPRSSDPRSSTVVPLCGKHRHSDYPLHDPRNQLYETILEEPNRRTVLRNRSLSHLRGSSPSGASFTDLESRATNKKRVDNLFEPAKNKQDEKKKTQSKGKFQEHNRRSSDLSFGDKD